MTRRFAAITMSTVQLTLVHPPANRYIFSFFIALSIISPKVGTWLCDINCCIAFTRIQTELPTPVTIIFSQHQDVVYCVNAVPAGLSAHPSPLLVSIYREKIAAHPRIVADYLTRRDKPCGVNKMPYKPATHIYIYI